MEVYDSPMFRSASTNTSVVIGREHFSFYTKLTHIWYNSVRKERKDDIIQTAAELL